MRVATIEDVVEASVVLAKAFLDDPIQEWLFPAEHRRASRLQRIFALELKHHLIPLQATNLATTPETNEIAAVAGWAPPKRWRPGWATMARLAIAHAPAVRLRAMGGLRLLRTMETKHPSEPHWYLAVLGTDPAHQGRGHASATLRAVLDRCDSESLPAYLESSKEENLAFYQRQGFEVTERVEVKGPPPAWLMWREPRPGSAS